VLDCPEFVGKVETMPETQDTLALQALAGRIAGANAMLLNRVRADVLGDPNISIPKTLARDEFLDHLPKILDALACRLRCPPREVGERESYQPERIPAAEHGVERWMQGYSLSETIREWRYLTKRLVQEMWAHVCEHPELSRKGIVTAMGELLDLIADGIEASAAEYNQMQRASAAGRAAELEAALRHLEEVHAIESRRATTWRRTVHDLRGSVGAMSNAIELFKRKDTPGHAREESQEAVNRGLVSIREMLNEVAEVARLEAALERLQVSTFDVSDLLRKLAEAIQPSAALKGLLLSAGGPDSLEVEGDAVKIRRVAQNLLINAVKYTQCGAVSMNWRADHSAPQERWVLTVRDTGPGLDARLVPSVVAALQGTGLVPPVAPALGAAGAPGEGIGLSIVRNLCEMLHAAVELENEPGQGLAFHVFFPSHYTPSSG
jgi:signal transduction histidine kinase